MEHAALSGAHSHARRAMDQTARSHMDLACKEHELAAKSYSEAASDVKDSEALRILKLLEEQHRKLAQVIRIKDQQTKKNMEKEMDQKMAAATKLPGSSPIKSAVAPSAPFATSEKHTPTPLKTRDTPSSLAKDIASRRGIPQRSANRATTNVSSVQATGRVTQAHRSERATAPPTSIVQAQQITSDGSDDGFSKFYASLTSGPLSRLSSMLAYTGLPLTEQDESPATSKTSARVASGPDPNQIFSKAALKALEEQQRHPGAHFGPHESFYVIPATGGTSSYASILSGKIDDSEEFVDAKEVMTDSMRRTPGIVDPPSSSIREEELQIENAALKQILDKLSHRLQAFESHAQDASMNALAQSMASVRSAVPVHELEGRMRAMESQLEREMKERERLGLENQKNKQIIAKYRSHWEALKDSARAKEKARREKDGGAATT